MIGQDGDDEKWRIDTTDFAVAQTVEWERHAHEHAHEILWGCRGTLTAATDDGFFAVPHALALWIPAGVHHQVTAASGTRFRCTYIDSALPGPSPHATAIAMPELVQSLLERLADPPYLAPTPRTHAENLVTSLLEPAEVASVDLRMPRDVRTKAVAERILANPADDQSIEDWGYAVGSSARNLSRLFVADTGLSFAQWRTRARMRRAVELLAADHSVTSVAARVGYASPSAFVQAFRRELGRTPGEYVAARPRAGDRDTRPARDIA
ncbi:helix-turn-helix domain-containing protein [Demequina litorisediminis]|uniref:AraC family transcriptional regulator n=1 Tax=Demequina litorisediminis TaxID=1849022 RepID=A0ABQ6IE25_9MICO|nr:AraC family transcriptional regulator [Demequina litorisediminis]GMA36005.1 AraC family transcriptional regulator [Demequina litorisediminis]